MKTFDFDQTGGLKLVTETLSGIQDSYQIFKATAKMAGDRAILTGCEELSNTVSDGVVVINGEILDFKGGVKQDYVIIKEEKKTAKFEDGTEKPFEIYRYATFGFLADSYPWNTFLRVPVLINLPSQLTAVSTTLNNKIDALANAIGFLRKGEFFIGDINGKTIGWEFQGSDYKIKLINNTSGGGSGGDDLYQLTFNNPLDDSNYRVFTSIRYNGNYVANNDVIVTTSNFTNTGFQISARELSMDTQNITVDYIIYKK